MGIIVGDENGEFNVAAAYVTCAASVLEAEAKGVKESLILLKVLQLHNVVVETDLKMMYNEVNAYPRNSN